MIDLVILVVYLAAVLFAGLHFAKKEMNCALDGVRSCRFMICEKFAAPIWK